jgi:glycosyltransferase involved in cell wall biosynthesis
VILLAYNHERYIEQAVLSALMQRTGFAFEIIIGEDASKDSTATIVRRLQADHPDKIRATIREQNVGMHRNFIESYQACTGEYVALLDGDDYWTAPDKLQKQVDFLDCHPECSTCFHNAYRRQEDRDEIAGLYVAPQETRRTWELEDLIEEPTIPSCSIVTRNRLVDRFPDWILDMAALDWVFNLLNARHGSAAYLPEPMAVYRMHAGGTWSAHDRLWHKDQMLKIYERLPGTLDRRYWPLIRKCQMSIKIWYELEAAVKVCDEQRTWNKELVQAKEWLEQQWREAVQAYNESLARNTELGKARDELARQLDAARGQLSRAEGQSRVQAEEVARLRARLQGIENSRGWRLVLRARRLVNSIARK